MNLGNSFTRSASKVFVLIACVSLACVSSSSSNYDCDAESEYTIVDNITRKKLRCYPCNDCDIGFELSFPCGSVATTDQAIGLCKPCNKDTYSAKKGKGRCQDCRSKSCKPHEVVRGQCNTDTEDTSFCTGICERGYTMNKEGTMCVKLDKLLEDGSTKNPERPISGMAVGNIILFIVFGSVLVVVLLLLAYCCWKQRIGIDYTIRNVVGLVTNLKNHVMSRNTRNRPDDEHLGDGLADHRKIHKEESQENAASAGGSIPPIIEDGCASTTVAVSCSDLSPQLNCPIVVDGRVGSPDECSLLQSQSQPRVPAAAPVQLMEPARPAEQVALDIAPEQLNIGARPVLQAPNNPHIQNRNPRLRELCYDCYQEICETLNHGASGKDCDAFARHEPCFTQEIMRKFERKENRADHIIRFWEEIEGNDAPKFVEILKDMGMTHYANRLAERIHGMNGD